jgi:hypothetical protein
VQRPPYWHVESHASNESASIAAWECVCPHMLASSVLCRLGAPFRRRGGGQESTPLVLLFLRHNASYLCMQVQSIFFRIAPARDEGAIEIHHREGKQSQEDFLLDQRENVCYPRIRAKYGLGQNQIHLS